MRLCKLDVTMEAYYGYLDENLVKKPIVYDFEAYGSLELDILLYQYRNQNGYVISYFGEKPNCFRLYGRDGLINSFSKEAEAQAEMLIKILEELKGKLTLELA